jgi:N-acetylglucosaminyl-diphospho-decaprenol L-rhamnosyltransferase
MKIVVGIVFHGEEGPAPLARGGDLEVLVRTNAGTGQSATPWLGFGANHNRLIEQAEGADWYVALNPDVEVTAAQLCRLIERAEEGNFSIVAPMFGAPWGVTGAPQKALPGPRQWMREIFAGSGGSEAPGSGVVPSEWVSGACLAIRMTTLRLRFDERYFMYFEDADLCCRAREAGGRVGVCPEVVLPHGSGWSRSDPLLSRRGTEFARSAVGFARRTGQSPRATRLAGFLRFGSRLAVPGRTESERAGARAISSAFLPFTRQEGLAELAGRHNERLG